MTDKTLGKRPRRVFSPEYKHEAVRLVIDTGHTIAEVARELGVGSQSLGKRVAAEHAAEASEPTGELTLNERDKLEAPWRQVAELHNDNEFLAKAAAFFATKQRPTNGTNYWRRTRPTSKSSAWHDCGDCCTHR